MHKTQRNPYSGSRVRLGVTQSCVTAGIVLLLVLFILSLSSGMGGEKEKDKE
jgi:hypothetical protein